MSEELKPCRCGEKAVLIESQIGEKDWIYYVKCPNCGMQTPESYYKGDVIAIWNGSEEETSDADAD